MGATSEHFSQLELQCHCGCGQNGCTQALVDALESLRALAGVPIRVDSAFRCEAHNASLPNAAQHSQHELGNAADIVIEGLTPAQMELVAFSVPAVNGVGRADHQGYIHVDVRPAAAASTALNPFGGVVLWCYDTKGNECLWYPAS